jgi:hypothetical protein
MKRPPCQQKTPYLVIYFMMGTRYCYHSFASFNGHPNAIVSKGVNLIESVQGQVIAKAGWNYYMLDHDGSYGAHSPNLALEIIESSIMNMNKTNFNAIIPMK